MYHTQREEEGKFEKIEMEVKKSVEGVRINPPVVEFHDVTPDALYQIQLTVQNFGKTSRRIRFHQPTSEVSMDESENKPSACIYNNDAGNHSYRSCESKSEESNQNKLLI